jgi:hypothetical protein
MNRRDFLGGTVVYGRSPAMAALPFLREADELIEGGEKIGRLGGLVWLAVDQQVPLRPIKRGHAD